MPNINGAANERKFPIKTYFEPGFSSGKEEGIFLLPPPRKIFTFYKLPYPSPLPPKK